MFDKIAEQFQSSFKPVADLVAINAKAVEQLAQQQTSLFTGVLNDSVAYAEGISSPKDIASIFEAQKSYAEGVQEKVVATAKDAYSVMSETQEKVGEVLKSAYNQVKEATAANPAAKATTSKVVK